VVVAIRDGGRAAASIPASAIVVGLLSLAPLVVAACIDHGLLFDDQLISLTYAKNLARGDGFVFNHPPAVLGTTTPLFAMMVALLSIVLPFSLPVIAVASSAVAWSGLVCLPFVFRRSLDLTDWEAVLVGAVLMVTGWPDALGMETYVFLFFLFLAFGLHSGGASFAAGFVLGLLFLCRGEGALAFGLVFGSALLGRVSPRIAEATFGRAIDERAWMAVGTGFAIPMGLWCAYALPTFGVALPNTLAAKQVQAATGLWTPFHVELLRTWLREWMSPLAVPSYPWAGLWAPCVLLGLYEMARRRPRWRLFVLWLVVYVAGYSLLRVSAYHWYARPAYVILAIAFALGVYRLCEIFVGDRVAHSWRFVLAVFVACGILFRLGMALPRMIAGQRTDSRAGMYVEMTRWLSQYASSDESIASIEVGALGFYTDLRVIDLVGLVTPESLIGVSRGDFGAIFWRTQPDYLVYHPRGWMFFRRIVGHPDFVGLYEPVLHLNEAKYEIRLFRRRRAPDPAGIR